MQSLTATVMSVLRRTLQVDTRWTVAGQYDGSGRQRQWRAPGCGDQGGDRRRQRWDVDLVTGVQLQLETERFSVGPAG